ncbi:glycosyltransferase involved in cell wall biosynthesis [Hamadaea flava]|uniref:Glycosyltransferase family 2 protein n=1 Tax=Hamadaea flava TaxID=1742688 RepID=A0ABV8M0I6_9ACTN|nr:glycosyltransferase family 2 protein [Hamadaea flava]MCP2329030.1 glycosyltransferase involved in cell wall biosynthesis [Hamadaea flava]
MVDIILPCLNEAAALPLVLTGLPTGYRAIVADNGSTDDSVAVARAFGAEVVHVPQRGFGAAVHAGLEAATADVVCIVDADGSFDLRDLPRVVEPVVAGQADLMLGRRTPGPGAWPWHAQQANRLLAWWLRGELDVDIHDLGPMRAARRTELLGLGLRDRRFGYPLEMIVAAARAGWRIAEVPVAYAPRAEGTKSKVTGTVLGTARTVRDMTKVLAG